MCCVFKHLILGTLVKKRRTVKNKRDVDDFCKGRIMQLFYSKMLEVRWMVLNNEYNVEKVFN
jgi:hypothetical protein